jgi:hypothetical protein
MKYQSRYFKFLKLRFSFSYGLINGPNWLGISGHRHGYLRFPKLLINPPDPTLDARNPTKTIGIGWGHSYVSVALCWYRPSAWLSFGIDRLVAVGPR